MSKRVYLCPSNQWANPYAYGGTNEGVQMNVVADLIREKLKEYDVEVLRSDNAHNYIQHCNVINSIMPDVCIFIHSNGFNGNVTGTETLYSPAVKGSKEFAMLIQERVAAVRPSINRGTFNGTYPAGRNIGYMNRTKCASALVELEYHDVYSAAEYIVNHKDSYANAIVDAIVAHLGLHEKYIAPTPLNFAQATAKYYEMYPDVKAAGVDAWLHFCQYGKREGRQWLGEQGKTTEYLTVSTSFSPLWLNQGWNGSYPTKKVIKMPKGSLVELIERSNASWYKVKYNGVVGWATAEYLK